MKYLSWEKLLCILLAVFVVYRLFVLEYDIAAWIATGAIIYIGGIYPGLNYSWRRLLGMKGSSFQPSAQNHLLRAVAITGGLFWFIIPILWVCERRIRKRKQTFLRTLQNIEKAMM